MKRKDALTLIVAEVAEHGKATYKAIRVYVENRISMQAFNKAIQTGMKIYRKAREK